MERVPGWLALTLLVLVVLAAGWFSLHNLDIWLHARTGEWIVEHDAVPTTNVLSRLHAEWPTVDDKWGFQVVAHLLLDGLGPEACNAARIALMLALMLTCWGTARRGGAGPWWTLPLGRGRKRRCRTHASESCIAPRSRSQRPAPLRDGAACV